MTFYSNNICSLPSLTSGHVFPWPHYLRQYHYSWYTSMRESWAPSQYPKRRLSVWSRKVSKPRDLYLELSDRYEIWQALRQQCCRCACQISKRYDNLNYQSRGFETLRDLTERRLFGYWDGALAGLSLVPLHCQTKLAVHYASTCNSGLEASVHEIVLSLYYLASRGLRVE